LIIGGGKIIPLFPKNPLISLGELKSTIGLSTIRRVNTDFLYTSSRDYPTSEGEKSSLNQISQIYIINKGIVIEITNKTNIL
jgi:hypothetical protein